MRVSKVVVKWIVTLGAACTIQCSPHAKTSTFRYAIGWSGALPTWNGPCTATPIRGNAVSGVNGVYRGVASGYSEFQCKDGILRLEIAAPTTMQIEHPKAIEIKTNVTLALVASDASGNLELGDTPAQWTLPSQVRTLDRCSDMGSCIASSSVRVTIDEPATIEISAKWGGLSANAKIVVKCPSDIDVSKMSREEMIATRPCGVHVPARSR